MDCTEHVTVITAEEQAGFFGEPDPLRMPAAKFDVAQPYWQMMTFAPQPGLARASNVATSYA